MAGIAFVEVRNGDNSTSKFSFECGNRDAGQVMDGLRGAGYVVEVVEILPVRAAPGHSPSGVERSQRTYESVNT